MSDNGSSVKLAETAYGTLYYNNGELMNQATVNDPVAFRASKNASDMNEGGSVIAFIGVGIKRSDNKLEEIATITGKRDERYGVGPEGQLAAGEWEFAVRLPNMGSTDGAMKKVARLRHDSVEFFVPVLSGPINPSVPPNELRHPDGIHWLVIQGDGNFVVYKNSTPFNYNTGVPLWASGIGSGL